MVPVTASGEVDFDAAVDAAVALWRDGQHGEAGARLEALAAAWPQRADPLLLLGMLLLEQQDDENAERALAEAVARAPDDGVVHFRHAEALAQCGRFDEAAWALTQAIERSPREARPYVALARLLAVGGQRPRALVVLEAGQGLAEPADLLLSELARLGPSNE